MDFCDIDYDRNLNHVLSWSALYYEYEAYLIRERVDFDERGPIR